MHDNRIDTCFYGYDDEANITVTMSETSVHHNRIETFFNLTFGGEYTVSACEFRNNTVETCFRYETDAHDLVPGTVTDADGNKLDEAAFVG